MSTGKKHSRDWEHDEDDYHGRKEKKKAEKKVEKVAKMLGYSNEVNPFGDTNLLKPFVWGKKQDQVKEQKKNKKEKKQKKSSSKKKRKKRGNSSSSSDDDSEEEGEEEENEEEKRLKLLQEIEKVRKRRETREKELEDMQRLRDEEQRLRELAAYSNWQDKEEEFHLEQIKERTKLRLLTNRCHLIDRIITNIVLVEAARQILTIFQNNHKREVEELLALSQLTSSSGKWREEEERGSSSSSSSASITQSKNNPNRKLLALLGLPSERDSPVDIILQDQRYLTVEEIKEVLEDLRQLQQLDERRQLTKYKELWISLIAVLSSLEKKKQQQRQLLEQQGATFMSSSKRDLASFHESIADDVALYLKNKTMAELASLESEITQNIAENKKSQTIDLDYWEYMVQEIQLEKHKIVINQVNTTVLKELKDLLQSLDQYGVLQKQQRQGEDRVFLYRQKQQSASEPNIAATNKNKGSSYPVIQDSAIDEYMREMENEVGDGMDESEETKMLAADEIFLPIPDQQYHSQDKYRPRKPRYFNRVKTGWDRNKYNLTHYDPDNPPPKMIQGYKFTIFYPDLIDKTVTPRYFIEPCPDSISSSLNSDGVAEFVMIRFHAGPPYEDIAFKIINKQWDTHKRSGFVSTFDRGILQLHFNFKRVFYRR